MFSGKYIIVLLISLEDDGNLLKVRTISALAIEEWKQQILCKVKVQTMNNVYAVLHLYLYNYLNGVLNLKSLYVSFAVMLVTNKLYTKNLPYFFSPVFCYFYS